ncbi:TIGR02530 family flagellar biosynthesis protein [Gracilibacillus thailandensis]|uniref:Flagellar protein n=1 Tax=Gracilibacillus thailandensis TaxID=563735 RepID=A0A6N7QWE5_9BACI|nr:TIGR02530 family flagellar biosynthesis protein [Gracilibacillus thailandensis]MRI65462.1 flagellar protein [Gracilibacillus thailandensis]
MDNRIHAYHHPLVPKNIKVQQSNSSHFAEVLKQQQKIEISKHASDRMTQRNIHLSDADWNKMNEKLDQAKDKGVKESLVIMDEAAFIVNAESKKVITALDKSELSSKIFTNINGTIVMD